MTVMVAKKEQKEEYLVLPGKREQGIPIFAVLVKRTYVIRADNSLIRKDKSNPLVKVDIYYEHGDPEWATVQYETDLVPYKLATDVVLIGTAYAPGGNPITQMEVALQVGDYKKVIRVIGDRYCIYRKNFDPVFSAPLPFTQMEIRYERAYGGYDLVSIPDLPFYYPRNPRGTGLAIKNIPGVVDGLKLPNLEDPDDLITPDRIIMGIPERWNRQFLPQGFGWYQRTWYPRCSFVGSVPGFVDLDEVMREETLGLVPKKQVALARQFKLPGFDLRFNNGASPGLALPYLNGNELIRLINLTSEGQLEFYLPVDNPKIMLDIGLGENELRSVLHTVCIKPEELQVDLVWRGAHDYPGLDWLPEMTQMKVEII